MPEEKKERNDEIIRQFVQGKSYVDLAIQYNLSTPRVRRIIYTRWRQLGHHSHGYPSQYRMRNDLATDLQKNW